MIHRNRMFKVLKVENVEDLAEMLVTRTWCLCNGFEWKGLLLLNDAFSEDGAQEYAVMIPEGSINEHGYQKCLQVESYTASWCKIPELVGFLKEAVSYIANRELAPMRTALSVRLNHPQGSCELCR